MESRIHHLPDDIFLYLIPLIDGFLFVQIVSATAESNFGNQFGASLQQPIWTDFCLGQIPSLNPKENIRLVLIPAIQAQGGIDRTSHSRRGCRIL